MAARISNSPMVNAPSPTRMLSRVDNMGKIVALDRVVVVASTDRGDSDGCTVGTTRTGRPSLLVGVLVGAGVTGSTGDNTVVGDGVDGWTGDNVAIGAGSDGSTGDVVVMDATEGDNVLRVGLDVVTKDAGGDGGGVGILTAFPILTGGSVAAVVADCDSELRLVSTGTES